MSDNSDIESNPLQLDEENDDNVVINGKLRSKHWKYFDKDKYNEWMAVCRFCNTGICYKSGVSNLGKHLKRKHKTALASNITPPKSASKQGPRMIYRSYKPGRLHSMAWKRFTIVDKEKKHARCNICQRIFIYGSTVSNLTKHLYRTHKITKSQIKELDEIEQNPFDDPIWAFFVCLDEVLRIAKCLLCNNRILYSEGYTELKNHLLKKHPSIDLETNGDVKPFTLTEKGDLHEVETAPKPDEKNDDTDASDNENYNEVYLDSETLEEPESKASVVKRQTSNASDVSPQKIAKPNVKINEREDSFDLFGKYLVSLLRNLSKESADRLQYEFVKQVFEEQSKLS